MCREYRLCEATCFQEHEAKQGGIAYHRPDSSVYIGCGCYTSDQNGVDSDTHHDEETLERYGKQGFQIIVSHARPFRLNMSRGEN